MVQLPTGEDAVDGMEGQCTRGKLYNMTDIQWRMDQYRGVRMNKAKGKHAKGTQKIGDIPGAMSREEAGKVCSQMNENAGTWMVETLHCSTRKW